MGAYETPWLQGVGRSVAHDDVSDRKTLVRHLQIDHGWKELRAHVTRNVRNDPLIWAHALITPHLHKGEGDGY